MNIAQSISNLKTGDKIVINEWQHCFTVCGISEKHVIAMHPESNEYTIIQKDPTAYSYNGIPAGAFICGADFWIFGYAGGYRFDDCAWVNEYLSSLASGETEISMKRREQIHSLVKYEDQHEHLRLRKQGTMEIRPITLRQASEFINQHHRHHNATIGCKFAIGCYNGDNLVGCAVCGRPVSRHLDDGLTCEINRLCTDGTRNACSMLYGACCRVAKAMGYRKVITYILQSENGASLKASNFTCEGIAGGVKWTGARDRGQNIPHEMKTRWSREL